MDQRYPRLLALVSLCLVTMTACSAPPMSFEAMKAMMLPRSPELDALEMLAGDWTTEGQVQFIGMDEPITTTGTSSAAWACDKRFLIDRSEYDMGPLGPMTGVSIWGWDPQRKHFVFWWFDGFGERATGTARYDKNAKVWHIITRGQSTRCNVKSKGTIKMIDANTLEWTWEQWSAWGFLKYADMKGVSRRK